MSVTVLPVAAAPRRYSVVGAAALDLMAAIAGPAWTPDHERAWSAAFEVLVRVAGPVDEEQAAAA